MTRIWSDDRLLSWRMKGTTCSWVNQKAVSIAVVFTRITIWPPWWDWGAIGGPSGRAEGLTGGGEQLRVEVVGEAKACGKVTTTLMKGNGNVRDAGKWFGKDDNDSVKSCCPGLSLTPTLWPLSLCMHCLDNGQLVNPRIEESGQRSMFSPGSSSAS